MKNKERYIWITILVVVISVFSMLYLANPAQSENENSSSYLYGRIFEETYKLIRNNYVDPQKADVKTLYFGAIDGLMRSLEDEHTSFLPPKVWKELREGLDGQFEGLGIHIGLKDHLLTVISPIEGSPAFKAGLRPNDIIYKIEGKITKGITLVEAVNKLRGPRGSKVTVTIVRSGETQPFDVTITRDVIKVPSVRFDMIGDTGYIRIIQFQRNATSELRNAIKTLYKKGMKKLILDLRNNPGGYLGKATDIVDLFISKGRIVSSKGRVSMDNQEYFAHAFNTICRDTPLVVMINNGSASASEIVAGAIQDTHRGIVVGEKSYGKGSVQRVIPLSSGEEEFGLKLTTAFYYTAANRLIHGKGIVPDIVIKEPEIKIEEILAQKLIENKKLLKNFLDKNRRPTEAQVAAFHAQLIKMNLPVSLRILHRMIYIEQHKMELPPVYDLKWDVQLTEALKIFKTKPQLFKRPVIACN